MTSQGLGSIVHQVAMEEKIVNDKKIYFIDIEKENIIFPQNKFWEKLDFNSSDIKE